MLGMKKGRSLVLLYRLIITVHNKLNNQRNHLQNLVPTLPKMQLTD